MNATTRTGRRQFVTQGAAALAAITLPSALTRTAAAQEETPAMDQTRVRFTVDDTEIIVRIADNPTGRDFVSMLPLTLTFEEFAGREKISYLPRALTTAGSTGHDPVNRDLIYYVPWGNLGFFYNAGPPEGSDSDQVILIGVIETGFELLEELETGPVRVEVIP